MDIGIVQHTTVEWCELGHWVELGQKFSEASPLLLNCRLSSNQHKQAMVRMTMHALNFCSSLHQCPLTSNCKVDYSLNISPNSHQCPNSPHSTVHVFKHTHV